jgi:hypothetical protein
LLVLKTMFNSFCMLPLKGFSVHNTESFLNPL